jgi:hypothetical protein
MRSAKGIDRMIFVMCRKFLATGARFLLIYAVGLSWASCSERRVKYQLADISDAHSPVHVTGYVTFSDDPSKITRFSYRVDALARNVSNKKVMLLCIHFRTDGGSISGLDHPYKKDYFFSKDGLVPGLAEVVHSQLLSFGESIVNGIPEHVADPFALKPEATAKIEFVQFTDGSTWGDPDAGEDVLKVRRDTIDELRVLDYTYEESGAQSFRDELSKEMFLPTINVLKNMCEDRSDYTQCVLDKVQEILNIAGNR